MLLTDEDLSESDLTIEASRLISLVHNIFVCLLNKKHIASVGGLEQIFAIMPFEKSHRRLEILENFWDYKINHWKSNKTNKMKKKKFSIVAAIIFNHIKFP